MYGKHLRPLVVKIRELDNLIVDTMLFSERLWILRSALVIMKYYISAFVDCGFPLRLNWRNIDLSFGSDEICDLDTFKSRIKASLVWPTSCLLGNRTPIVLPFRGPPRKYVKQILRTKVSMKKLSLVQTILIGVKTTAAKMPRSQILSNQEGCVKRSLAAPRQTHSQTDCVLRACNKLLRGFNSGGVQDAVGNFSLRSNLESNRESEGSYGQAKKLFGVSETSTVIHGGSQDEVGVQPVPLDTFLGAELFHRVPHRDGVFFNEDLSGSEFDLTVPYYFVPKQFASNEEYLNSFGPIRVGNPHFETELDDMIPWNHDLSNGRKAVFRDVLGLPEPCKVRCITLSHWWESPLWGHLQRRFTRYLARNHFVASGKELEPSYFSTLAEKVAELSARDGTEFVFVSDDGDAATDSICLRLSNGSLRKSIPSELIHLYDICSGITGDAFVRVAPTTSQIKDDGTEPSYYRQINSQYMGDRLSFVKLTVIHACYKLVFLRRYAHVFNWSERDIRNLFFINGDDGVIAIPKQILEQYVKWMGTLWNLNSIKTQVHRDVFTINSRMFKISRDRRSFDEVSFFRYNLLERQDRGGGRIIDPQVWNVFSETASTLMEPDLLWSKFHREWSGTLQYLTKGKGNNYFLPEIFGGLGLVPLPGQSWYTNSRQRYAIIQTLKRKDKELPPPRWMTQVVPVIKHSGVKRDIRRTLRTGLSVKATKVHFTGTAAVKGVTTATKLFTRRLPRGNHVHPIACQRFDLHGLVYGELRDGIVNIERLRSVAFSLFEAISGLLCE